MIAEMRELYEMSGLQGYTHSHIRAGECHTLRTTISGARSSRTRNSANMGNAEGMFSVDVMHARGEGVQMDREKAMDALFMVTTKDFCGGSIFPGCGGTGERSAGNAVLETSEALSGTWDVKSLVFTFGSGDAVPQHYSCVIERMASSVLEEVTIALPNEVSAGVQTGEGGICTVTAGWLVEDSERVTTRTYLRS